MDDTSDEIEEHNRSTAKLREEQLRAVRKTIIAKLRTIADARGPNSAIQTLVWLKEWSDACLGTLGEQFRMIISYEEYEGSYRCAICDETTAQMVYCAPAPGTRLQGRHIICTHCAVDPSGTGETKRCEDDHEGEHAIYGRYYPNFDLLSIDDNHRLTRGMVQCDECKGYYPVLTFNGHDCKGDVQSLQTRITELENAPRSPVFDPSAREVQEKDQQIEVLKESLNEAQNKLDAKSKELAEQELSLNLIQNKVNTLTKEKEVLNEQLTKAQQDSCDAHTEAKKQKSLYEVEHQETLKFVEYSNRLKNERNALQAKLNSAAQTPLVGTDNQSVPESVTAAAYARGKRDKVTELAALYKNLKDVQSEQDTEHRLIRAKEESIRLDYLNLEMTTLNTCRLMRLHLNNDKNKLVLAAQPLVPNLIHGRTTCDNVINFVQSTIQCGQGSTRTGCVRLNNFGPRAQLFQIYNNCMQRIANPHRLGPEAQQNGSSKLGRPMHLISFHFEAIMNHEIETCKAEHFVRGEDFYFSAIDNDQLAQFQQSARRGKPELGPTEITVTGPAAYMDKKGLDVDTYPVAQIQLLDQARDQTQAEKITALKGAIEQKLGDLSNRIEITLTDTALAINRSNEEDLKERTRDQLASTEFIPLGIPAHFTIPKKVSPHLPVVPPAEGQTANRTVRLVSSTAPNPMSGIVAQMVRRTSDPKNSAINESIEDFIHEQRPLPRPPQTDPRTKAAAKPVEPEIQIILTNEPGQPSTSRTPTPQTDRKKTPRRKIVLISDDEEEPPIKKAAKVVKPKPTPKNPKNSKTPKNPKNPKRKDGHEDATA